MMDEIITEKMCLCSLSYKKLQQAIENGECDRHEKLKDDKVNKFSAIHRIAGITFCRGWNCQHRKQKYFKFTAKPQKPSINLSQKEKEYLKRRGWDFILDDEWLEKHMFIPRLEIQKGAGPLWGVKSSIPMKSKECMEKGDIIIFHDSEERTYDGEFHTDRFVKWMPEEHSDESCPAGLVVKHKDNIPKEK